MKTSISIYTYLGVGLLAALVFIPFLGQVHLFDWDEVNFAEGAREMLATGDYTQVQIDFKPFWEKPPLFIWLQALSMSLWGVNEFGARFPNAVAGIATLMALLYIGNKTDGKRLGLWWAALYAGSWLPHFYFKTAIIDPIFNLFIFLAFFQFYLLCRKPTKWPHALWAGAFLGLAFLTKGPVAILVALLCLFVLFVLKKGRVGISWAYLLLVACMAALVTFSWLGIDMLKNGLWFTKEFITYQIRLFRTEDAGHGGPFFYHFLILLVGCFPASLLLFQGKAKWPFREKEVTFEQLMWTLFWVVLILFSIVQTKIVHYSSLCYFPLTYLAAQKTERIDILKQGLGKVPAALLVFIGVLLALAIALMPLVGIYKDKIVPYIDDEFAVANLQAQVPWSIWECLIGVIYLLGIIICVALARKRYRKGLLFLLGLQVVVIEAALLHFVPKVEAYSQRAAVDFYKSFAGKEVYLQPLDFVSYGYLFYSRAVPSSNPAYFSDKQNWLLEGDIDRPAYFITKITSEAKWSEHPHLKKIGEKNGFVFFVRIVP